MSAKRVIPCLDIKNGRVVKGINFVDLIDAGDPVEAAKRYNDAGADELVFLDISATLEGRGTTVEMVKKVASQVTIPFTVGGGIRSLEDIRHLFEAGADKVSLNSAAISNPSLLREAATEFGSQRIVCAIDVRLVTAENGEDSYYEVLASGGTKASGKRVLDWAKEVEALGAGEILLTSMDKDGMKNGYDNKLNRMVSDAVSIPVTASGGAGQLSDFYDAIVEGGCEAVLAASLFHFGIVRIPELKEYLSMRGVPVIK